MIPSGLYPEDFDAKSREDLIYESLQKSLGKDYFVFHSVQSSYQTKTIDKEWINREAEADFIIFHPKKGIVVIEAKFISGFSIEEGKWMTDTGEEIHHGDGPYRQVKKYLNILKKHIDSHILTDKGTSIREFYPVTYIVWFHKMTNNALSNCSPIDDPEKVHTFTQDDLDNPKEKIDKLLEATSLQCPNKKRKLTQFEMDGLQKFFEIKDHVFDASGFRNQRDRDFKRLLDEQIAILDYLEFQDTAAIQGLGGTGKTVIAVEKAKRNAVDGKTMFLCFNVSLKNALSEKYANSGVDFYDLVSFRKYCSNKIENPTNTYEDCYLYAYNPEKFEYKHVVIDEGQDLARDNMPGVNESINKALNQIQETALLKDGSFYIFFDRYQCVQSDQNKLPDVIRRADCLLTLVTNCRNTKQIANTSISPIRNVVEFELDVSTNKYKPRFNDLKNRKLIIRKGLDGEKPALVEISSTDFLEEQLERAIERIVDNKKEQDVVILTVKSVESSALRNSQKIYEEKGEYYFKSEKGDFLFNTVRKFKGLESEAIIIIDVCEKTFSLKHDNDYDKGLFLFYVGCSRAKALLYIIATLDNDNLREILETEYNLGVGENPRKFLINRVLGEATFEKGK